MSLSRRHNRDVYPGDILRYESSTEDKSMALVIAVEGLKMWVIWSNSPDRPLIENIGVATMTSSSRWIRLERINP